MGTDVNSKINVRGDGLVVLYQRQNRDVTINPIYQIRMRLPLTSSKGYYRGSTGETDKDRATQIALNKYEELYFKVRGGRTLLGKSFRDLFDEWKTHYPKISNETLPKYIEWSVNRVGNYPYHFFVNVKGNPKVDTILPKDFEEYWIYRRENSTKNGKPSGDCRETERERHSSLHRKSTDQYLNSNWCNVLYDCICVCNL